MAEAPSTGMEKSEMRNVLKSASPDTPVSFAFAQGKDARLALIKLDKRKSPQACKKALEDEFKDAKNVRWGTLVIDSDADPSLARFVVNKAAGGMARKLSKTLKGTGGSKVELMLEDGTLAEAGTDAEDETEDGAPDAQPAAPETVGPDIAGLTKQLAALLKRLPTAIEAAPSAKDRLVALATEARDAMKTDPAAAAATIAALSASLDSSSSGPAAPSPSPAPDKVALTKTLSDLLKQIPAVLAASPDSKATLLKLAGDANAALKTPDLAGAASSIEALRTALQPPETATATQAPSGTIQVDEKRLRDAIAEFHDDLAEIGNRVEALKVSLRATDDPGLQRVAQEGLTDLTGGLRVSMSKALFEVLQSQDSKRVRAAKVALKLSSRMRDFVSGNELFDLLDRNPFSVKLDLKQGLNSSLTRLDNEMKAAIS